MGYYNYSVPIQIQVNDHKDLMMFHIKFTMLSDNIQTNYLTVLREFNI